VTHTQKLAERGPLKALVSSVGIVLATSMTLVGADEVAFNRVTVVDVVEGRLNPDQLVRISGERIVEVAPSAGAQIPQGTRVVDAAGRFLIPGLWDMHAHFFDIDTPGCPEISFPLTVAHGVTGARDVEGYLDLLIAWRAEIESGRIVGPTIVGTGPLIDGVPVVYPPMAVVARTPEDGRRIVDALAARGADFVKAYEMLRRDTFFAIVDQAKKRGLPVAAHVPLTVLAGEASDAGVRSFEHLRNIELACSRDAEALLAERTARLEAGAGRIGFELRTEIHWSQRMRALDTYDAERCTALMRKLAANGTWQAPTLFNDTREARRPDFRDEVRETLRWVPELQRKDWEAWSKRIGALAPEAATSRKRHADWLMRLARRMNEAGIGLLAGTDISSPWMVPGAALHEELRVLVEAGLTPLEALRTATSNPARYFERSDEFGAVAPGRIADVVLLDADPLVDIGNARRIRAVVARGRYLDRSTLDGLLATAERTARSGAHDLVHRPGQPKPVK
jgi:imidazolonepropionase-like amidohydrolase